MHELLGDEAGCPGLEADYDGRCGLELAVFVEQPLEDVGDFHFGEGPVLLIDVLENESVVDDGDV